MKPLGDYHVAGASRSQLFSLRVAGPEPAGDHRRRQFQTNKPIQSAHAAAEMPAPMGNAGGA